MSYRTPSRSWQRRAVPRVWVPRAAAPRRRQQPWPPWPGARPVGDAVAPRGSLRPRRRRPCCSEQVPPVRQPQPRPVAAHFSRRCKSKRAKCIERVCLFFFRILLQPIIPRRGQSTQTLSPRLDLFAGGSDGVVREIESDHTTLNLLLLPMHSPHSPIRDFVAAGQNVHALLGLF